MKLKRTLTYRLMLDYLKGKLSNSERHVFEKELMRNTFDEEAFEGLSSLPADEIEKDISLLQQKLNERTKNKNRIYLYNIFKVAASIIILISIVVTVRITNKKTELPLHKQIAEKKESVPEKRKEIKEENVTSVTKKPYAPLSPADEKDIETPMVVHENLGEAPSLPAIKESRDILVKEETHSDEIQVSMESEHIELAAEPYKEEKEIVPETKQARRSLSFEKAKAVSDNAIHGRVTDNKGNPLPGVAIIEKGTSNGVVSDINGEFDIALKDTRNPLEFKFIGYITEEITAENIKDTDVQLVEDLVALDEVVVMGYGVQKKSDLTGAVSSVKREDKSQSVNEALQGRAAGVSVVSKKVENNQYKGIVTDSEGVPLPGVSVMEKGTSNFTTTNTDGSFEISVKNSKSTLEFKYIGYITKELIAKDIKNSNIKLSEDLVALDEIAVIGYGAKEKSENIEELETIKAIPPTGSVLSYKKYIYKEIDYLKFPDITEKQKVIVEFTLDDKGIPGNFKFKQPADERVCNEIKRLIDKAGKWQPSMQGGSATATKIRMRFVIDPVSKRK